MRLGRQTGRACADARSGRQTGCGIYLLLVVSFGLVSSVCHEGGSSDALQRSIQRNGCIGLLKNTRRLLDINAGPDPACLPSRASPHAQEMPMLAIYDLLTFLGDEWQRHCGRALLQASNLLTLIVPTLQPYSLWANKAWAL